MSLDAKKANANKTYVVASAIVLALERLRAGEIEIHDWMADAIGGRVRAAADAGISEPERLRDEALLHLLGEMRQRMAQIQ